MTNSLAIGGGGPAKPGGLGAGGGILAVASLTLRRCLVSGNQALVGSGTQLQHEAGYGGGIVVSTSSTATVLTLTVTYNAPQRQSRRTRRPDGRVEPEAAGGLHGSEEPLPLLQGQ